MQTGPSKLLEHHQIDPKKFVGRRQGGALKLTTEYTAIYMFAVLIRLAIITVTVILAAIFIIDTAIHAVTVIQPCLGRPW